MIARQVVEVSIDRIDFDGNVRESYSEELLRRLSETIQKRGVQQPVTLRRMGDRFTPVSGYRRTLAAKLAGLKTVPALIDDRDIDDGELLASQLIENLQREDLTDLEKAKGIDRLIRDSAWSAANVAKELGLSPTQVSNLRSLLCLPASVQGKVASGELPASTAVEIARTGDTESQIRLADEAARNGLTRDAVAGKVKAAKGQTGVTQAATPSRVTALVGSGRAVTVAGPSLTLDRFIECLEELLNKARKARPKGMTLTTFCRVLKEQARA